jgi:hypothetical protein
MKALVYHGPGERGWDTIEDPNPALFATHRFALGDSTA